MTSSNIVTSIKIEKYETILALLFLVKVLSDKLCSVVLGSLRSSIAAAQKKRAEVVPDKPSATHPASFCPRDTPSGSIPSYAYFQWGSHGQNGFLSGNHKNYWRDWRRALDCKNPKAWSKRGTPGCRGNPRDHTYQLAVGFDQQARFSNCWRLIVFSSSRMLYHEVRSGLYPWERQTPLISQLCCQVHG